MGLPDFRKFVINTIVGGLVVLLPMAIFFILVRFLFNLIISILRPILSIVSIDLDEQTFWALRLLITIAAIAVVIIACFMIGLAVRTRPGQRFWKDLEEEFLFKLPLYGSIKEVVMQVTGKAAQNFSKVVVLDVFGNGTLMTGFVTDEHPNGMLTIFVPTAPNPTNGFVFHVQPEQVKYLDTNTENAMRSIIAVGTGSAIVMANEKVSSKQPYKKNVAKETPPATDFIPPSLKDD